MPRPTDTERLCECHNVSMLPYQNVRYSPDNNQAEYYWRCRVKHNEWAAQRRKHRKESEQGYVEDNYKRYRDIRLKNFGITENDYTSMLESQNGQCAICDGPPDGRWKRLAVDHCHTSGEVRGLLCMVCNTMLGRFETRQDRILQYLGLS